ncbi:hypothetical protein ABZ470_09750 [Streptosporangium sp. NPDC020072]|uniref:hypothetical protein n=1 Tax=Streptosporangium sp. NPDC020072 TaxID=3154788 RepID=UPI00342B7DB5
MSRAPLCEVAGVVEAPPDRVGRLILTVGPGPVGRDNAWLYASNEGTVEPYGGTAAPYGGTVASYAGTAEGGPRRFTLRAPAHTMTIEVTGATLAVQDGWWYRGEHTVEPHPEGTLLIHRVFNVAEQGRWAVPLANRFFAGLGDRTRNGFAEGLRRLGLELGCGTRLL